MGKKDGTKRGRYVWMIHDRLEKGPATPKQLSKELKIPYRSVTNNIKKLRDQNSIQKIDNDKYALIGSSKTEPESEIEESYSKLKRKFMRNLTPDEIASDLKKLPDEAIDLLFKYVTDYREPTEEEIYSASFKVLGMVIRGAWDELDPPKSKKEWFEQGIDKVVVIEGIVQESFNKLLENKPQFSLDEARSYLGEFPEMKANITPVENGNHFFYKIEWSDDARNVLHQLRPWDHTAEILLPIRYPEDIKKPLGYDAYRAIETAEVIADIYVPSQKMIDDLLGLIGLPHFENKALITLKKFCQNALEVDQLDDETKYNIALELLKIAFSTEYEIKNRDYENPTQDGFEERRNAFDIIEILNVREPLVVDAAKTYSYYVLELGRDIDFIGPDATKVVQWLAQDPNTRIEITEKIKEILTKSLDDVTASNCIYLIKTL